MAAVRIPILEENMHGKKKYCTYLMAYLKSKGLAVGDTWIAYEYMEWITDKHEKFRELIHSPCFLGYNEEQQKQFEKFILEEELQCVR